jgi:hypothetical protein
MAGVPFSVGSVRLRRNNWMDIQHIATPEAGKDCPRNWNEFLDWFGSEKTCLAFYRLLERTVVTEQVTCDNVVKPLPKPAKRG